MPAEERWEIIYSLDLFWIRQELITEKKISVKIRKSFPIV